MRSLWGLILEIGPYAIGGSYVGLPIRGLDLSTIMSDPWWPSLISSGQWVSEQPFIYSTDFHARASKYLKSDYTDRLLFRVRIKKPDWVLSCQMTCLRFSQGPRSELMVECKLLTFSAVCNFRPHCRCGVFWGFFPSAMFSLPLPSIYQVPRENSPVGLVEWTLCHCHNCYTDSKE